MPYRYFHPSNTPNASGGFTLLEMVLVVFIMGVLASVSLTFVEARDQQWRYDETVAKAEAIQRAVLDVQRIGNQPLISGFVVDNGVLPDKFGDDNLKPLADTTMWLSDNASNWLKWGLHDPYYQASSTTESLLAGNALNKGARSGYITEQLDSQQQLHDGWGVPFLIDPINDYQIDSTPPGYSKVSKVVPADRWQLSLSSLSVTVENGTDVDLNSGSQKLALLVFRNEGSVNGNAAEKWITYFAELSLASHASQSITGTDWLYWNGTSVAVSASGQSIPVGEHLLAVISDASTVEASQRIQLYPGALPPTIAIRIE